MWISFCRHYIGMLTHSCFTFCAHTMIEVSILSGSLAKKSKYLSAFYRLYQMSMSIRYSDMGYNLACILTFPCAQRQGFGRFLISFSYELSKKEEKVGSPEKPLSDLGAVSYKSYWASTLLVVLRSFPGQSISIMDLTRMTSILAEDVVSTLQMLGLLQQVNSSYVLCCPPSVLAALSEKYPASKELSVDPAVLHWAPLYVTDPKKDRWHIKAKRDSTIDS